MEIMQNNHHQYQSPKTFLSDKELFEIFPEGKIMVLEKIEEWETFRKKKMLLIEVYCQRVIDIFNKHKKKEGWDYFFIYFWCGQIPQYFFYPEIAEIDKHLYHLRRQKTLYIDSDSPRKQELIDWEEKIRFAREKPIEEVVIPHLTIFKDRGNLIIGRCPFHDDLNPSLAVYKHSNSFYCFACHEGGDVISFVQKKYQCSFKEAIALLV